MRSLELQTAEPEIKAKWKEAGKGSVRLVRGGEGGVRQGLPWCRAGVPRSDPEADGGRSCVWQGGTGWGQQETLRRWHGQELEADWVWGVGGGSGEGALGCRVGGTLAPVGALGSSR